jgi:DNA-binding CsgD family transcriptional regulator
MERLPDLDAQEQNLTFELMEALISSLDLSKVLARAYEVLSKLLAADYAAICISKPGRLPEYDWMVAAIPTEDFTRYQDSAPEDVAREVVLPQPHLVVEGQEPPPPPPRHRELGMPLEHVMAVLLDVGCDWHGGFMLYRDRRQPFSERERALMQRIAPLLTKTVRNCRLMGEARVQCTTLEQLFPLQGVESIVMASAASERMRTPGATALLASWFPPEARDERGLPFVLLERLKVLTSGRRHAGEEQDTLKFEAEKMLLRVNFVPLPERGSGRLWGLLLQEVEKGGVPPAWRGLLTPREVQVVEGVLQGWDNGLIAEHLECSLGTVKKHLQRVFDKLGVDSRGALMNRASRS